MHRTLKLAYGLTLAVLLAACGGGGGGSGGGSGGDDPPAPPPPPAKLTSQQILDYSVHSVFTGTEMQAPSGVLSYASLLFISKPSTPPKCDNAEGTADAVLVDADGKGPSLDDRVDFTFDRCEYMSFTLTGKASVTFTELPPIDAASTAAKTFGFLVKYDKLDVNEGYVANGAMGVTIALPDLTSSSFTVTVTNSQTDGQSLTVSYSDKGENYSQTITKFKSSVLIPCFLPSSLCNVLKLIEEGVTSPPRFDTLEFVNKGTDPVLGTYDYRVSLLETLFPYYIGKLQTIVGAETITTIFSELEGKDMVNIESTGGATWSGTFAQYARLPN